MSVKKVDIFFTRKKRTQKERQSCDLELHIMHGPMTMSLILITPLSLTKAVIDSCRSWNPSIPVNSQCGQ